jgi:ABC-type lipoprotein release transport system permease subunit
VTVPFELQIALRYLLRSASRADLGDLAISTLGVTVGVMAVIVALAIMTGLSRRCRTGFLARTRTSMSGSAASRHKAEAERLARCHMCSAPRRDSRPSAVIASGTQEPIQLKGIDRMPKAK